MEEIPMVVCKHKIQHDCEKCGHVTVLAYGNQKVRIGEYKCEKCDHPFKVEKMPDGEICVILSPIDNTK